MKDMINIALPKGRLGDKVYDMFESAGYPCPSIREDSRKLIFESEETGVRYFWVKPSDVAIYVERGAADIGVAGTYMSFWTWASENAACAWPGKKISATTQAAP